MGYPSANPHRRNRRRLQTGQGPFAAAVSVTATPSGSTVTFTFSKPVNISGPVAATVATRTFVSQSISSPTVLVVTYSGTVATLPWAFIANDPAVLSYEGGLVQGAAGTFP